MLIAFVMDPLSQLKWATDSTVAMIAAVIERGWTAYYIAPEHIVCDGRAVWATCCTVTVQCESAQYTVGVAETRPLTDFDYVLIRKDPPFDVNYLYLTYVLEQAERQGVRVVNRPAALRDANEKLYTLWFSACMPRTRITADIAQLRAFIEMVGEVVVKPLNAMAGRSVFYIQPGDRNINVILETVTERGKTCVMAQQFIPEIAEGDKRILLLQGEPVSHVLARVPAEGDFRGNLAAGARAEVRALTDQDRELCRQVGPTLRDKGLWFVGLDVIGDYITEINVTSPTGIREIEQAVGESVADQWMTCLESQR